MQYVSLNNVNSKILPVTCGVPQGSILGPLLFILFINDITNVSTSTKLIMFADDTNLFFKHENVNQLFANVNKELKKVSKWFKLNKLSLNIKKTNFIIFRNKNKIIKTESLNITIDNIVIDQVYSTKFLGVIINSNLTWHDHIKAISNKVSKSIGLLLKIRKYVPNDVLLTLYHTLIEPYFSYCNIIWGTHHSKYLDQLFVKQKKAIRIITNSKWNVHTNPLLRDLQLLSIFNLNKFQTCCFMYKIYYGLLPTAFLNFLE